MDFKQFGDNSLFSSFYTETKHRGYDTNEDHIWIFLNYELQRKTKSKLEAANFVADLLCECPKSMPSYLVDTQYVLFQALGSFVKGDRSGGFT